MAKQTVADRQARLDEGCCPIHGLDMGQVDVWYYIVDSPPPLGVPMTEVQILQSMKRHAAYTIVACPRKDCGISAKQLRAGGPAELTDEWLYLLEADGVEYSNG
jgi:hypothetical protein